MKKKLVILFFLIFITTVGLSACSSESSGTNTNGNTEVSIPDGWVKDSFHEANYVVKEEWTKNENDSTVTYTNGGESFITITFGPIVGETQERAEMSINAMSPLYEADELDLEKNAAWTNDDYGGWMTILNYHNKIQNKDVSDTNIYVNSPQNSFIFSMNTYDDSMDNHDIIFMCGQLKFRFE